MTNFWYRIFFMILCNGCTKVIQGQPIVVGTLESNFIDREGFINQEQNKRNPYYVLTSFIKAKNGWQAIEADTPPMAKSVITVCYGKKAVGKIKVKNNASLGRQDKHNAYRIVGGKIPHVGKKDSVYAGWISKDIYRPLVTTNRPFYKRYHQLTARKPVLADSLKIVQYLTDQANALQLGPLPKPATTLVGNIEKVCQLNDSVYFVMADIYLNMYCYAQGVSFERDTAVVREGGWVTWTGAESNLASGMQLTQNACFWINGQSVFYIDHSLTLLDYADYDNDGYEEFIFMFQKYNQDGYIMVCDQWRNTVKNGWSYH
jgi:hypothetical protein